MRSQGYGFGYGSNDETRGKREGLGIDWLNLGGKVPFSTPRQRNVECGRPGCDEPIAPRESVRKVDGDLWHVACAEPGGGR